MNDGKIKEFIDLKMRSGMTVEEYMYKFNRLSHFAPHIIPNERAREEVKIVVLSESNLHPLI